MGRSDIVIDFQGEAISIADIKGEAEGISSRNILVRLDGEVVPPNKVVRTNIRKT